MRKNSTILLLAAFTLIGCNKSQRKLPSVDEATILDRSVKIVQRQRADQPFPNAYSIEYYTYEEQDNNTYDGKTYFKRVRHQGINIDMDKLLCREYNIIEENNDKTTDEQYYFYDEKEDMLCRAYTKNGYKYYNYNTQIKGKDAVKNYIITFHRNSTRGKMIFDTGNLAQYPYNIEAIKALKESLKDKPDQYCNSYYGSSDEKSVQLMTESKVAEDLPDIDEKFKYTGYTTVNTNSIYENDLLTERKSSTVYKYTAEGGKYYSNATYTVEVTADQTKSNINIPNLSEYVKE